MSTTTRRNQLNEQVYNTRSGYTSDQEVHDYLASHVTDDPREEAVQAWLASLGLLYGVPFVHMVADYRMFPAESIRFFYVDPNWIKVMQDGALSVGVHSSKDEAIRSFHVERRQLGADARQETIRPALFNQAVEGGSVPGVITGFLMRSSVVSGWPGLEVLAYSDVACLCNSDVDARQCDSKKIAPLRLDRLAPDILLGLYPGVPAGFAFREPGESLHFGVTPSPTNQNLQVVPRGLGLDVNGQTYPAGQQLGSQADWVTVTLRGSDSRVVNVGQLVTDLQAKLQQLNALLHGTSLSSSQFAVEMFQLPEALCYVNNQAAPGQPSPQNVSLYSPVNKQELMTRLMEEQNHDE